MNKNNIKKYLLIAGGLTYIIGVNVIVHDYHLNVNRLNKNIVETNATLECVQAENIDLRESIQAKNEQLKMLQDIAEKYYKQQAELKKISDIILSANPKLDKAIADDIANSITINSVKYDVPKEEILAVIKTESNFTPDLEGTCKDRGLMQIIPATEKEIAGDLALTNYDIFNVNINIEMGTYYIHKLKDHYGRYAYIVYNQGFSKPLNDTTYDRLISSNSSYIHKVLNLSNSYKEEL